MINEELEVSPSHGPAKDLKMQTQLVEIAVALGIPENQLPKSKIYPK